MSVLKLTFENGDTTEMPFTPASTLTVSTPDGVNGEKRGAWSEITAIDLTDDAAPIEEPAPVAPDVVEPAPAEPVVDPIPEPDPEPVTEPTPDAPVTPEPDPVVGPKPVDESDVPPADPATPADAIEAAAEQATTADALTHIQAALDKWPDDPDLAAAKADLEGN